MSLSLNSKEGRSLLTSLASDPTMGSSLSPEAGRGLIGALGFRLVRTIRQIFQDPSAYQAWLDQQRSRVANQFIALCQKESVTQDLSSHRLQSEARGVHKGSELNQKSLDKLKSQSTQLERMRVMTPKEFEELLTPASKSHQKIHFSGLQKLIHFLNPFDQTGQQSSDWLSQFRTSGQALKIEMNESLETYYDLLQSAWSPADTQAWVSIGAHLVQLSDELARLCQTAEELILMGYGKEAGFNQALIFSLLKGLVSERTILTYAIAHPELVKGAKNWDEAITKVRAV